jgi:hypothetical protein
MTDNENQETQEQHITEENTSEQDDTTQNTQETSSTEEGGAEENSQEKSKVDRDLERAKKDGVDVKEFEETRKALAKANKEAQKRREQLRQWDELGADPEQVKELIKQQREAEIKQAEEEGRYQELIEKIRDESTQERKKYQERLTQMEQKIQNQVYEKDLQAALMAEDGIPDLLESKLKKQTKMVEDGDTYKTVVLDEDGLETDMSVRDLLKQWKNDDVLSHGFKAPKVSGNGTSSNSASKSTGKAIPKPKRSDMSLREKDDYRSKYGLDAYKKLPL